MLKEFVDEVNGLLKENESLKGMIDLYQRTLKEYAKELLKYRLKEYENIPYEKRAEEFSEKKCAYCIRWNAGCKPPKDVLKPYLSEGSTQVCIREKGCDDFEWD